MHGLFSRNKLYLALLFFFPVIIIVSWLNGYLGNLKGPRSIYENTNYFLRFIFPAIITAYALSVPFGERLARRLRFSFTKILLSTLTTLIVLLVIVRAWSQYLGYESMFLTPVLIVECGFICPGGIKWMYPGVYFYYFILLVLSMFIVAISYIFASAVVYSGKPVKQKNK